MSLHLCFYGFLCSYPHFLWKSSHQSSSWILRSLSLLLLGFRVKLCFTVKCVPVGQSINIFNSLRLETGKVFFTSLFCIPVSTSPAKNRSPINVFGIGFNTVLVATPLCQKVLLNVLSSKKILLRQCDRCRVQWTIHNSTEEAHDYIHSFLATTSYCWFPLSF